MRSTYYRPLHPSQNNSLFQMMLEEQLKQPEKNNVPMATHRQLRLVANNGAIVTL